MMLAMAQRKPANRGKYESYDADENEALRQALVEYAEKNDLSSTQIGKLIGVSQQTASGYMNGSGGFSRPAAVRFCQQLLGYESDVDFLKQHGVFMGKKGSRAVETAQDWAMGLARRAEVSELAIGRVNKRYANETHHTQRWWLDRYLQEQHAVDEERLRRLEAVKRDEH